MGHRGRLIGFTLLLGHALVSWAVVPAFAQEPGESRLARRLAHLNPFSRRETDPAAPVTLDEVGRRIDDVGESMRDDGFVILQQPDVYSQARMTKYRREFEEQLKVELTSFKTILAGRVARLDTAAVDSQTALGASLGPAKSNVTVATPTAANPPVVPALTGESTAPRFLDAKINVGKDDYNLGLEPTIVLDEKQRYINHLNEIRRVNLGDDVSDSAGYGLYLLRLPLSITPGECTLKGHGAEITVTAKHEFPADFLPATYRNLVVNDLVDLLGPPLYELARTKESLDRQVVELTTRLAALDERKAALQETYQRNVRAMGREQDLGVINGLDRLVQPDPNPLTPPEPPFLDDLALFVLGQESEERLEEKTPPAAIARRLGLLADALEDSSSLAYLPTVDPADGAGVNESIRNLAAALRAQARAPGQPKSPVQRQADFFKVRVDLLLILTDSLTVHPKEGAPRLRKLLEALAATATAEDKPLIEDARALLAASARIDVDRAAVGEGIAKASEELARARGRFKSPGLTSNRIAKRSYPIAPRDLGRFFLDANLMELAVDLEEAKVTDRIRSTDVRSYLRQQLSVAFDLMSTPVSRSPQPGTTQPDGTPVDEVTLPAPLSQLGLMDEINRACHARAFDDPTSAAAMTTLSPFGGRTLGSIYRERFLPVLPANLRNTTLGALCWAIAIDSSLLDEALHDQVKVVFATNGRPCPDLASIRFYWPTPEATSAFEEYVTLRWPIITFAVDPTTDQQNILDNFSLRRDLQLAVAFAFSTGKINFSQMNTFRRKIETDNETIALNKTVTSFVHGHETFGWRITPRFQTPPSQGNLATLGSTLLRGAPGPNYGLRKSKLEAGQRELTAVVVLPSFLPTVRVEAVGNWFRLDDPEHPIVDTRRMLEQGRRVQDLRQTLAMACNTGRYRPTDVRFLSAKIDQIESTLPIQSLVVPLPFDNAANGFDLFTQGTTALVPELSGFEGVDAIVGGRECDVLLFGRFISIHETRVVAGGRHLPDTPDYVEILSREVVRVRLPGDVLPSRTHEGGLSVELYLATPNGISNRLLIPFKGKPGERAVVTDLSKPPGPQPKPASADPAGSKGDTATDPTHVTVNLGTTTPAGGGSTEPPAKRAKLATPPAPGPSRSAEDAEDDPSEEAGRVISTSYFQDATAPVPSAAQALGSLIPPEARSLSAPIMINPRVSIGSPASPTLPQFPQFPTTLPAQVTVIQPPAPAPAPKPKHHSRLRELGKRLMPSR